MNASTKTSLRFAAIAVILIVAGALAVTLILRTPSPSPPAPTADSSLDLTQPLPREQVLDLFRQLFALPAEDYINWEASVAAGRIPPDVRAFHEHIVAFNEQSRLDPATLSTEDLPTIELPDGPTVHPILKETLGPIVGANVSQEDLNTLLPEVADMQQRVFSLEAQLEAETEATFTKIRLDAEDFGVARVHESATPDTIEIENSSGSGPNFLHVDRDPALHGGHVIGGRITTEPFTGLRLQLTEEGSESLAKFTSENAGELVAILIDGRLHSTIAIAGQINTRDLQLPGRFTEEQANKLLETWSEGTDGER